MKEWFIIGLGNPGEKYSKSRHNAGFIALNHLQQAWSLPQFKHNKYFKAMESTGIALNSKVHLIQPTTFMNLSGDCLSLILRKAALNQVIVLYDDIDLALGSLRIRGKGRAGSHNGMKSLIQHARSEQFLRIRLGIRPDHPIQRLANFVLSDFTSPQMECFNQTLTNVEKAAELLLQEKTDEACKLFNQKQPPANSV